MKKILLINPAYKGSLHSNIKVLALPPLNLAIIARYTPEHYDVQIVDEAMEDLDFDAPVDLVGITCMTPLGAARLRNRRSFSCARDSGGDGRDTCFVHDG